VEIVSILPYEHGLDDFKNTLYIVSKFIKYLLRARLLYQLTLARSDISSEPLSTL